MKLKNLNTYVFFGALAGISLLTYQIFAPFIAAIFVAAVLAIIFQKPYQRFLKLTKNRKALSSSLTCLLILFIIILPLSFTTSLLTNEISSLSDKYIKTTVQEEKASITVTNLQTQASTDITPDNIESKIDIEETLKPILTPLRKISFLKPYLDTPQNLLKNEKVTSAISQISQKAIEYATSISQSIASIIGQIVVMLFSLFYFLIDGKKAIQRMMDLSPLANHHEEQLLEKFSSMSRATIKGTLVIGLIQGSLGGLAFLITGIASPVLWTVIMILLSVIPLIGPAIVMIPAAIIMFAVGNIWQGIFLLIATGIISGSDNILRPALVGKDTQMHSLLIFFATIGGISAFGILGFIIGPVVMALFISMWDIYGLEFKEDLAHYNSKK